MSKYKQNYKLANIVVRVEHNFPYIEKKCAEYVSEEVPEIEIILTEDDINFEETKDSKKYNLPKGYLEFLALYRRFVEEIALRDNILLHSAAVEVDGKAYLFTAPSGTGKTTHTRLWEKILSNRFRYINGDKPILSIGQDITVWGTPWDGKEALSRNASAVVAGICIIERGKENKIERIDSLNALPVLLSQTYRSNDFSKMERIVQNVIKISKEIPIWKLKCNISEEAAIVAYEAMSGKHYEL